MTPSGVSHGWDTPVSQTNRQTNHHHHQQGATMNIQHDLIQLPLSNGAVFSIAQHKHSSERTGTYTTHEVAVLFTDEDTGFLTDFVPVREWSGIVVGGGDNSFRFTDIRALGSLIAQATAWAGRTVPA